MSYTPPATALVTPQVLSVASPWCSLLGYRIGSGSGVPSGQTGQAANLAIYAPFVVTTTATFTRGFWWNGATPANYGNACVAIYDTAGARLATTGAVAGSGASVIQSAAFTASVTLTPGSYYMGISFSASGITCVTGNGSSTVPGQVGGYTQAVGSHPLPATATFATWTSTVTPIYGIATTSFAI